MALVQSRKHVLFDGEMVKWIWDDWELMQFRGMWNEGVGIADISKVLKCKRKSIVLLVMDQADDRCEMHLDGFTTKLRVRTGEVLDVPTDKDKENEIAELQRKLDKLQGDVAK